MAGNDTLRDLFDTLTSQSTPPFRPSAGTQYLYVADEPTRKSDWRTDGFRWRQNGTIKLTCSDGGQLTKTYFRVRRISLIYFLALSRPTLL